MVITRHFLNGKEINNPKNAQELTVNVTYDKDSGDFKQAISVPDWDFVRENNDLIEEIIDSGTNGGTGVFEGRPYEIEVSRGTKVEKLLNGYLDLTEEHNLSNIISTVRVKERGGLDSLNDRADGVVYEELYRNRKTITKADFIYQPYILNSAPDYLQTAILTITAFTLGQQIRDSINRLQQLAVKITNPFEATAIIATIIEAANTTLLILGIIKTIKEIVNLVIQPVKYHAGMYLKTLLQKGAEALGYTVNCPDLDTSPYKDAVIMPEKYYVGENTKLTQILGFTEPNSDDQEGFFKGTFGDILRITKQLINGKCRVENGVIHIIRRDKSLGTPKYTLPDLYQPYYRLNTEEFNSTTIIAYETDISDNNTIQEYAGTSYQVVLQPERVSNRDLVQMKNNSGIDETRIPLAKLKRKKKLTNPEKIADAFLTIFSTLVKGIVAVVNAIIKVVNVIIKVINGIIKALKLVGIKVKWQIEPVKPVKLAPLTDLIDNRIGMAMLESDSFDKAKIYILEKGSQSKFNKVSTLTETHLTAKYLFDNYYYINSFFPQKDNQHGNQYIYKKFDKVPFTFDNYQQIKTDNIIFVGDKEAELQYCNWNVYDQVAEMEVKIPRLYTNNFKLIEYEPTGA